jgi:hypothetical protein
VVEAASRRSSIDGWARPWPAGLEMLCHMLSDETHHRGQVYARASTRIPVAE